MKGVHRPSAQPSELPVTAEGRNRALFPSYHLQLPQNHLWEIHLRHRHYLLPNTGRRWWPVGKVGGAPEGRWTTRFLPRQGK